MRSKATARTLEALIGSSLGAGTGAAAGALSYAADSPVEWLDDNDEVQSRNLTEKERTSKRSRAGSAALLGAAAGAGGALGLSRVLRSLRTAAEHSALKSGKLRKQYIGPLEDYATDLTRRSPLQTPLFAPQGARSGDSERLRIARDLIERRSGKMKDLLAVAKLERDKSVFGGLKKHPFKDGASYYRKEGLSHPVPASPRRRVFSPQTHEGQIMDKIFGGPKGMDRFNSGPPGGPFANRGMRGSYEDLVERLYRIGKLNG